MSRINRRNFLKLTGGATAALGVMACGNMKSGGGAGKDIVIVGGGVGGSTAAKYIMMADPSANVTIIEPNKQYYTCFMSNEVLGGVRDIRSIRFTYDGLKKHGVNVVHDLVTGIDATAQTVKTAGGNTIKYDRCIVSPGIDFKWEAIEGYDANVANHIPHAWKAGQQTMTLRKQLEGMRNGGTFVMVAPPNPFRCPPGPYERVSLVANYLKKHKPRSKIIVLDPKDKFSKFGLFTAGWKRHYGYGTSKSMIEWVSGAKGGKVSALNARTRTLSAEVEDIKGDVVNIIPPQKAGKIAFTAGLTDKSGWCPVNHQTFESKIHKNIYVIGDSAIQSPLPKSGYAANSEAKVCAAAVVASLNGQEAPHPSFINTCYSIIAPGDGISVAMVYGYGNGKIHKVKGAGGLTPSNASKHHLELEAEYAHSWFNNITQDIFG